VRLEAEEENQHVNDWLEVKRRKCNERVTVSNKQQQRKIYDRQQSRW